jgi:transposase
LTSCSDTTSTYWETETADELAELVEEPADDELSSPAEAGTRAFGHSKDHRADLPQVVIAMAVTTCGGVPVRCWTFPGNTADTAIIRTVKDDLGGWGLRRLVWVADRGFACAANRAYLTRGGGHYLHAEKLRHTNTEAPPRWPARVATAPWPTTYEVRKSPSPPAGTVTATTGPAHSGS